MDVGIDSGSGSGSGGVAVVPLDSRDQCGSNGGVFKVAVAVLAELSSICRNISYAHALHLQICIRISLNTGTTTLKPVPFEPH
jgi:hypothetical protein